MKIRRRVHILHIFLRRDWIKFSKRSARSVPRLLIAGKAQDKAETVYEIADLAYHVLVLMVQAGISVEDVRRELAGRHVINKKVKQEKMASDKM